MMLAKALYDNTAETPDELTFRQGDLVSVLQVDFNGLEGWWLCSFNGKTGIAPGNRLKQVQDVFNGKHVNAANSKNDQTMEKVITPKKVGAMFIHDSPALQNDASQDFNPDYDQPRPGTRPAPVTTLKQQQRELIENVQDKLQLEHIRAIESLYDSPGNRHTPMLKVPFPESNRSSSISMSSVLSSISGTGSTGSAPPSERSSDGIYDTPPPPKSTQKYKIQKSKSSDMLDAIETYDYPDKSLTPVFRRFAESEPLYHTPGPARPVCSEEAGDYCEIQDSESPQLPMKYNKLRPYNVAVESQAYDSPKNLPFHSYGHYDVPTPQVSKQLLDVSLQNSQNNPEHTANMSVADIPDLRHEELRLEVGSPVSLLNKQQQDLNKSVERLLAFVGSGWRKKTNLEPKLFDVKISCIAVKTALTEFVEFANGALANSAGTGDKNMYFSCKNYFEPVKLKRDVIHGCMESLDDIKWDITKLSMETLESSALDDDLNKIISACQELPGLAHHLAAFILSKAATLFQNYQLTSAAAASRSPPRDEPVPVISRSAVRPKPKPPVLKPKPKLESLASRDDSLSSGGRSPPIQPKPEGLKNVPVETLKVRSADLQDYDSPRTMSQIEDYDVPSAKAVQVKPNTSASKLNESVTSQNREKRDDGDKDYDNAKTQYRLSKLEGYNDEPVDYDYAALTPDIHKTSLQYKYEQDTIMQMRQADYVKSVSKVSPETECQSQLDSVNKAPLNLYDTPSKVSINQSLNSSSEYYDTPPNKAPSYDTPLNKGTPHRIQNSQELYDSPVNRSVELYDSPSSIMSNQQVSQTDTDSRLSSALDMSGQMDKMQVPSIRTSGLSPRFKEKLEQLQTDSAIPVVTHRESQASATSDLSTRPSSDATSIASSTVGVLSDSDKQVLTFYANQLEGHVSVLVDAMEALFQAVDYNQPPKVFIAHSKFVILAAHKLVYIGDTISRNVSSDRVRSDIMVWSNQLCDSLKATVTATKQAALQYPSVPAMQEMVNKATCVSQITDNLKNTIMRNV